MDDTHTRLLNLTLPWCPYAFLATGFAPPLHGCPRKDKSSSNLESKTLPVSPPKSRASEGSLHLSLKFQLEAENQAGKTGHKTAVLRGWKERSRFKTGLRIEKEIRA